MSEEQVFKAGMEDRFFGRPKKNSSDHYGPYAINYDRGYATKAERCMRCDEVEALDTLDLYSYCEHCSVDMGTRKV